LPTVWASDAELCIEYAMELPVSTVNPSVSSPVFNPPNPPGELPDAILTSLNRESWGYRRRPWGPLVTMVLAAMSFGLLPLLVWPHRFRRLMRVEQQQLWHLAEWLRLRTGSAKAAALRDQSEALAPGPLTGVFSFFLVLLFVALIRLPLIHHRDWQSFWMSAYGVRHMARPWFWQAPFDPTWMRWSLIMAIGYFLHWLQVCRHAGAMGEYAKGFNAVIADEKMSPVRIHGVGVGFHPIWALVALVGVVYNAYWAIPMALAGAVHVRYVRVTSRQLRSDLARRVRWMLDKNRPPVSLRGPSEPRPCVNEKCRAMVPVGAMFCPRCGARTT
jgi:hypothetical protein